MGRNFTGAILVIPIHQIIAPFNNRSNGKRADFFIPCRPARRTGVSLVSRRQGVFPARVTAATWN